MKILHTADWHLGRLFFGMHLTSDQESILFQRILPILDNTKPDVMIIAGDIFDRSVPPVDAIRLYDAFLEETVMKRKIPVIAIAGNHDSPERCDFASGLLRSNGYFIKGIPSVPPTFIPIDDQYGTVDFVLFPYAENPVLRHLFNESDDEQIEQTHDDQSSLSSYEKRFHRWIESYFQNRTTKRRSVAVAHLFATGGTESESERPLSVGGSETIGANLLGSFDYTALGHLHRPQSLKSISPVEYSGSLMPYSFDECDHTKQINIIEMDADGKCSVERIPINPLRNLRIVRGEFQEIVDQAPDDPNADDYIQVQLTNKGPVVEAASRIRTVYPNLMSIQMEYLHTNSEADPTNRKNPDRRNELDLFNEFVDQMTGDRMSEDQRSMMEGICNEAIRQQREESCDLDS